MSPRLLNILLLISSLVIYNYVVSPLYAGGDGALFSLGESVQDLVRDNMQYDATIPKVDPIISSAAKMKKTYDNFDPELKTKINIMVPSKIEDVRLLSEVSNLANSTGVAVKDVSVKEKGGAFPKYNVNMSVKATYEQFKEFMAGFDTSLRLYTLESVSFGQPEKDTGLIKFDLVLSTHYLK
jgi:Tfp pilus assembly protein PilO